MSKTNNKGGQSIGDALKSWFTVAVILLSFGDCLTGIPRIMGSPINFEGGYGPDKEQSSFSQMASFTRQLPCNGL
jgi:hypothetical protein